VKNQSDEVYNIHSHYLATAIHLLHKDRLKHLSICCSSLLQLISHCCYSQPQRDCWLFNRNVWICHANIKAYPLHCILH